MYQNIRKLETIIRMYHAIRQNIRRQRRARSNSLQQFSIETSLHPSRTRYRILHINLLLLCNFQSIHDSSGSIC